ncbi:uncharacterized protein KRP23_14618 [Phytophthora ramorum]|uniref:uncharacterized protein n=1 Tax=Phytophthora ramorum TaxID=164328 RepID=UPI0030AFAE9F|nr:hypothetical protein KRP23_14618 [Phytophthora ramorum]
MVFYSKPRRTRFLLAYKGETSLGFQVQSGKSGKFVITSVEENSAASRAGLTVGDKCESYYADRMDANDEDSEWGSDTVKQLEQIALPKIDAQGILRRRCGVIVVGHNKADTRRTNFCNDNKRGFRFERQLQDFENRNSKHRLDTSNAPKHKKAKLDVDSDEEGDSEEDMEKEQTFQELSDRMSQYLVSTDSAAASVILDTLDFDPLARMNLKTLAKSLCEELCHLAEDEGQDSNCEDADMTKAVANLELLYKRVEETAALREKTAEGLRPEQMTAEHVTTCSDLINRCNEAITATTALLLKSPVSAVEQKRRQQEAQDRQHDQSRQLAEILAQCSRNVDECSAAAMRATTDTQETMVSVREKTEDFLKMASRESQDAVNGASDLLRTSKTVEWTCKEELCEAEHEYELAKKVSMLFNQALTVRSDLQKMIAAGQYKQRAEGALAGYVVVLANALRGFFQGSSLQQKQDAMELLEKHDELKELLRKYGSTRTTKQRFLESEISDIEAGINGLQRQRIQTMWAQQKMWDTRSLNVLTPFVKSLLESCYRDILDMRMKTGDDHPEWAKIYKSLEEVVFQKGGDDTDEEPIL